MENLVKKRNIKSMNTKTKKIWMQIGIFRIFPIIFISSLFIVILISDISASVGAEESSRPSCADYLYRPSIWMGVGVIIAACIIAIAYMIAKFSQSKELMSKVNIEISNIVNSVIISAVVLITLFGLCIYCEDTITNGESMYDYVHDKLSNIQQVALSKSQELTRVALSNEYQGIYYGFFGTPFTPSGGAGKAYRSYYLAVSAHQNIVVDILLIQYIAAKIFDTAFLFMGEIGLVILLPLAIVLRTFPIIRNVGNYLLAFVFAFGVIMPFVFTLNLSFDPVTVNIYEDVYIGNITEIARIVAHTLFFPNIAIAIAATTFLAVGRGLDSINI